MARIDVQIELSPEFKARLSEIEKCFSDGLAELRAENEKLKQFANYVMANSFDGCDTDGGDAQDEAERLGLLELRPIPEEDSIDGETEHYFLKWAPRDGE